MHLNLKSILPTSTVERATYVTAVLWSFSGVLIKVFLIGCNAFFIASVRGGIAALFQLAYLFIKGERFRLPHTSAQWTATVFFTANTILLVFAFQLTSVENAVFLHFSGMGMAAFAAPRMLSEKTRWQDWLSIGGILVGIGLLGVNLDPQQMLGNLLGILCGITLAIESIAFRRVAKQEKAARDANIDGDLDPNQSQILHTIIASDLLTCLIGCLMMAIMPPGNINLSHHWLPLLIIGIIPWAVPNMMYCYVVREIPSLVKAMIAWSIDPVLTALWTIVVTQHYPSTNSYIGCGTILVSVLYSRATEKRTSSNPEVTNPTAVIIT